MKNYYYYIAALLLALASCQADQRQEVGAQGQLLLSGISLDAALRPMRQAQQELPYALQVTDEQQQLAFQVDDHRTVSGPVTLKAGAYTLQAQHGEDLLAAFEAPYYRGSATFHIVAGQQTPVSVTACLANVKVSVQYSDRIKANFSTYRTVVSNGLDSLAFAGVERRAGYFRTQPVLEWTLYLTNKQGVSYRYSRRISGVQARDHYRFSFDVSDEGNADDGGVNMGVTVDPSTNDKHCQIDIVLQRKPRPQLQGWDFAQPLVFKQGQRPEARIGMQADALLQDVRLYHEADALLPLGLPFEVSLVQASESLAAQLQQAGLQWSSPLAGEGQGWIDLSVFATRMSAGTYTMELSVLDAQNQLLRQPFTLQVMPVGQLLVSGVDSWARFAHVQGSWEGERPEGLALEYRKVSEAVWMREIALTYPQPQQLSARLSGLESDTDYVVRMVANGQQGAEMAFRTEQAPLLPNMSMDDWHQSGKTWNPWSSGGSAYWMTGNSGVTIVSNSNTTPTEEAVAGKAAKLETVKVAIAGLAAGNLFTGDFKTNISNPSASVKFGRPYSGRPTALRGYYRYLPQVIDQQKNGSDKLGQTDQCHIYISLEDWEGASHRPVSPKVIAYGELLDDRQMDAYESFKIPLEYRQSGKPTHIVLVTTSSRYGDQFTGGVGSVLYVDELVLDFE